MRSICLIALLAGLLAASGCHHAPPPVVAVPAAPVADLATYSLFADGYARVPVALLSADDLDAAILARGAVTNMPGGNEPTDPQALNDLVLSGRLAVVERFTGVTKLTEAGTEPHIGSVVRVQIADGPYRGMSGWVAEDWLKK